MTTSGERYMQWYNAGIETFAPLSLDEERTCIEHIRACDQFARSDRERLVEAYSSLVVAIAETYGDRVVHIPDLLVDGNKALIAAIDTFRDSGESSFKPYVARLIEQAISGCKCAAGVPGHRGSRCHVDLAEAPPASLGSAAQRSALLDPPLRGLG